MLRLITGEPQALYKEVFKTVSGAVTDWYAKTVPVALRVWLENRSAGFGVTSTNLK